MLLPTDPPHLTCPHTPTSSTQISHIPLNMGVDLAQCRGVNHVPTHSEVWGGGHNIKCLPQISD